MMQKLIPNKNQKVIKFLQERLLAERKGLRNLDPAASYFDYLSRRFRERIKIFEDKLEFENPKVEYAPDDLRHFQ